MKMTFDRLVFDSSLRREMGVAKHVCPDIHAHPSEVHDIKLVLRNDVSINN